MAFSSPTIDPEVVDSFVASLTPVQRDLLCDLACELDSVPVSDLTYREQAIAQGLTASDMGLATLVVLDCARCIALTPLGHEVAHALCEELL
jgi:hypothetical protein